MALKLANVFDVSVDYLLGEGKHASYDKETVKRLQDIENLDIETKKTIFQVIYTFFRDSKTRVAYSWKSPTIDGRALLFLIWFCVPVIPIFTKFFPRTKKFLPILVINFR